MRQVSSHISLPPYNLHPQPHMCTQQVQRRRPSIASKQRHWKQHLAACCLQPPHKQAVSAALCRTAELCRSTCLRVWGEVKRPSCRRCA